MCGTPKEKPVQVSTVSKEESHRRSNRGRQEQDHRFLTGRLSPW